MPYELYAKQLRACINYVENKDIVAFKDGYRRMPIAIDYLKAAAENLLDMGFDPLVKRDHRLPIIKSNNDNEPPSPA